MSDSALNDGQREVLQMFFALPESKGFVLAGGAGLIAVGLSARLTEDLDLFTCAASIAEAADALEEAAGRRGWLVERIDDASTFRRVVLGLDGGQQVRVDLARDAGPLSAPRVTAVGPTYPPDELAARKVLALFDRAALRDFVDVATVARIFGRERLLGLAHEIDAGFDRQVFGDMVRTLGRFKDEELAELAVDPAGLREFFSTWLPELS